MDDREHARAEPAKSGTREDVTAGSVPFVAAMPAISRLAAFPAVALWLPARFG